MSHYSEDKPDFTLIPIDEGHKRYAFRLPGVRTMARGQEPVSEEVLAVLQEEMVEQREEVREELAVDLGGDPEDYNADTYHVGEPVADGGE